MHSGIHSRSRMGQGRTECARDSFDDPGGGEKTGSAGTYR